MPDDTTYPRFLQLAKRLTGVDLSSFRQEQLRRRLEALLLRIGATDFGELGRILELEPQRLQEFRDHFTVNVTEFFRDPERFWHLQTRVLPTLLRDTPNLQVWSAACSDGAEPYSVAILLKELAPRGRHRILATDVESGVLEHARRGDCYDKLELRNIDSTLLARYFTLSSDGLTYAVNPEVRKLVDFREHSLHSHAPGQGFDLILCRNVEMYLADEARADLYDRLASALRPGGVLFVGGTEVLSATPHLNLIPSGPSFYYRESRGAGLPSLTLAAAHT